ncbi:MAG TPA: hypothetical protein VLX28_00170 [Thermoanaerobaculia bacterium]|nr:hypothetical protein [Thermoanaerobaculia bacterium]
MKRLTLLLTALLLVVLATAAPVLSRPPLCNCPFCASNNGPCSYDSPGGVVITTCGVYFGSHCTGPN